MRIYYYRLLDTGGHTRHFLDALPADDAIAARLIVEHRRVGTVLGITPLPDWAGEMASALAGLFRRRIPNAPLAEFLNNLGVMLGAGLAIDGAIEELRQELPPGPLRALVDDLYDAVRAGAAVSDVFDRWRERLPIAVHALVHVGERSGNLDRALIDAAGHLKRLEIIRQDIRKAMIYPAFVFACVLAASWFWVESVLPNITRMFRQMNVALPPLTLAVMHYTEVLRDFIARWYAELLLGIVAAIFLVRRSHALRERLHRLAYHLPVTRTLVRTSALAFISEYLEMLLRAGIPLADALRILHEAVRNLHYKRAIAQMREGVLRGNRLSAELKAAGVFPGSFVRLVAVGEQSGNLSGQLAWLAEDCRRRLAMTIATLSEVLKPAVLTIAGGFFVFVIVVVLLPIYRLVARATVY